MNKNKLKFCISLAILATVFAFNLSILPTSAAVNLEETLVKTGTGVYGDVESAAKKNLPESIGAVVKVLLSVLGVVLVCIIVYAGYLWMTAGGDEKQVDKAKDWIKNAVAGMVIVISAYAIAAYVVDRLASATLPG